MLSDRSRQHNVEPREQAATLSFRAVNGWRGPGAIAIALAHLGIVTNFISLHFIEPIALVVDLFFVLSGLLISQAYAEKLRNASAIPEYVVRRFGRIWPVQAATLAILVGYELVKLGFQTSMGKAFTSPAFASDGLNLASAIPTNLLLIHSLGIHDRETWNFPSWSLSVEFFTYIVFAFCCLLSPKARHVLAAAIILVSTAILVTAAPYHMRSTFDYGIFRCLAGFFAGTICFEIVRNWPFAKLPAPTLIELGAVAMLGLWLSVAAGTYWAFAAPLVICLFLSAFLRGRGLLSRVLATKPLQVLADLSFTIYMVHAIVLVFLLAALHAFERASGVHLFSKVVGAVAGHSGSPAAVQVLHLDSVPARWALALIYLALVIALAVVVHRLVEIPGRGIFGKLAKRLDGTPVQTSVGASKRRMEPAP